MKILIIGFGKMGMLHAATARSLPGVTGITIAETSPLVRRAIGQFAPGSDIVADYRQALDRARFDGAVIATPTASHAAIFKTLAGRVRGIFVEKPFASSHAEAAEAAAASNTADAVMTGHCLRFSAVFEEAKRLFDAGAVGRLERFEATMFSSDVLKPSKSWRFKEARAGGGVLLDLGSHLVDMTRHFFGTPERVAGTVGSLVSGRAEDFFDAEWRYASGMTGKLNGSWSRAGCRKATLEIRVMGSNGTLTVCDDAVDHELREPAAGLPAGSGRTAVTALERAVPFDLAGPMYARQLEAWIASLSGTSQVRVNTLAENLADLRLIDAMRASGGSEVQV